MKHFWIRMRRLLPARFPWHTRIEVRPIPLPPPERIPVTPIPVPQRPAFPRQPTRFRAFTLAQAIATAAGGCAPWAPSDHFNRPDNGLGPNWTTLAGAPGINTNTAKGNIAVAVAVWAAGPPTADYWAEALRVLGGGPQGISGPAVRITGADTRYVAHCVVATDQIELYRYKPGNNGTIQTYANAVWPQTVRLAVTGTQLIVTIGGVPQAPETDNQIPGPGRAGIQTAAIADDTPQLDDFQAGT